MKSSRKKISIPLHFTEIDNSILLGIVSTEPDYKLSFLINKTLNITLKSHTPIDINDGKGHDLSFSKYADSSLAPDIFYCLFSNKSGKNILVKKLEIYDYLFMIQDSNEDTDTALIIQKMKEAGIFTAVFLINQKEVNDKYLNYLNS